MCVNAAHSPHGCVRLCEAWGGGGLLRAHPGRPGGMWGPSGSAFTAEVPLTHRVLPDSPGALLPLLSILGSHSGKTPQTVAWKGQTRVGGTSRSGH